MFWLPLLLGCTQEITLPDVGRCTTPPDGIYDYGQIAPGDCLAGPVELRFVEDAAGDPVLLSTNANPYQIFDAGSLLAIPWQNLDLSESRNSVVDLDARALELPSYSAGLDLIGDLGLVTVRLSEDSRTREENDEVYLIDLSDLPALSLSNRGTDGGSTVLVGPDPVDVVVDGSMGRAYVANRTAHSISVLDLSGDEVEVVLPWEEYALSSVFFDDTDDSGSRANLASLEVSDETVISDDLWSMEWISGIWRMWLPSVEGLSRSQTTGNGIWVDSAIGVELDVEDADGAIEGIEDPEWAAGRLFYADEGNIHSAIVNSWVGDWDFETTDLFTGREGMWDARVEAPAITFDEDGVWLFYEGSNESASSIGAAFSEDGYEFLREDSPVLEAQWPHEAEGIGDPALVFDSEIDLWRLFYSAYDGARWTIGHATSPDLVTWESNSEPILAWDEGDLASPVISRSVGDWKLWVSARTNGEWRVAEATSSDGDHWTLGSDVLVFDESVAFDEEPPGVALDANPTDAFRVEGEEWGLLTYMAVPGISYDSVNYGWAGTPVAGMTLDLGDAGSQSDGGIRLDSILEDWEMAWLTLRSSGGIESIGVARVESDGSLSPVDGAVLEGGTDFYADGVSSPVVVDDNGILRMFFAGLNGDIYTIGTATSSDGLSWTIDDDPVLDPDLRPNWESSGAIPGSIEIDRDTGELRLWYSGHNGDEWSIGTAVQDEGGSFRRDTLFEVGSPGDWDDTSVRDPWVVTGDDEDGNPTTWLFYAGFDGDQWQAGLAVRSGSSGEFERSWSERTGTHRPILDSTGGMFHPDGLVRPVFLPSTNGWQGWFCGYVGEEYRVGTASGLAADRLHKTPERPTIGDSLSFSTERGDPDVAAIPLDTRIEELTMSGLGLIALHLDEERGFLYALTRHQPWIVVIDVRDDSDEETGFVDLNYLDIESVIRVQTTAGAAGFRHLLDIDGLLYALNDDPDSVFVLDLDNLIDDEFADLLYDSQVGGLATERDIFRDEGLSNTANIGPGQMAIDEAHERLFVTNFNDNSVSVYDLRLGNHGQLVRTIPMLGENPYAIAIAPDEETLVVGNYTGETGENGVSHSTLAVIDINPNSAYYLEVLTWIVND